MKSNQSLLLILLNLLLLIVQEVWSDQGHDSKIVNGDVAPDLEFQYQVGYYC